MKKLYAILSGVALGVVLIVTMAVSMFACSSAGAVGASHDASADSRLVAEMLAEKLYKVDFSRAFPISAPPFALTGDYYYISVIGNKVESFLPYGGGQGLRFAAETTGYEEREGKNGTREISFDALAPEDTYNFELDIYPSGDAYLTVSSPKRQTISFSGSIDLDAEFEAVRIQ